MRIGVVAVGLALLVLAPLRTARAQFSFDARRIGMGGVSLGRDGDARRYNPAYRAVKKRANNSGAPKVSIPIPLGLIDFFKAHPINRLSHDPMFNPDSAAFNPVELVNYILNPPIFYEVRKSPVPVNDVEFTIGRNALVVDLGAAQVLIPEQEFGLGTTSRLFDFGGGFGGFNVGVMAFLQYNVGFTLDDSLRRVLKEADSVRSNTSYSILGDAVAQGGLAPSIGYSGRIVKGLGGAESDDGVYVGGAFHYYLGATFARGRGPAGFTTGNPVLGTTPVPLLDDTLYTSNKPNGRGYGGDVGVVFVSGPFEVGVGANDIGAQLTWSDTKAQNFRYDAAGDSISRSVIANHVQSKTKLPITYVANAALRMGTGTTVGGDVVNSGRGTVIHVGMEQRYSLVALRAGVSRDQRKRMQFGWGAGLRLGAFGLDLGFWTHSNTLATTRAVTMATSISIY